MLGTRKPKNRRRQEGRRWRLPAVDWRRVALSGASVATLVTLGSALAWTLDQPIQTVSVQGLFQRVSPVDVERAVKDRVRGFGLVSVSLPAVQRSIEALPWVDTATVGPPTPG